MELKELQKMVYEPYEKLGFYDQWNVTELRDAVKYLENDNAFKSAFPIPLKTLKDFILKMDTLMQIAEVGLFSEENGEILDAIRKGYSLSVPMKDTHKITSVGEECADLFIRLSCYCERMNIDLESEIQKKHKYNSRRAYLHGKKA